MYDGGKIIVGLVLFVGVATLPFIWGMGRAGTAPDPKLDTPEIQKMSEKKCIESTEFMRTEHMQLLNFWRDSVVRTGERVYTSTDGVRYEMSLQKTCQKCHSNKKEFCDACHDYAGVEPYCWDCHTSVEENEQ